MDGRMIQGHGSGSRPIRHPNKVLLSLAGLVMAGVMYGCTSRPELKPAEPAQDHVTKGPYLMRVEQNRAALMWETDTEGPWGVSYGKKGGPETCLESAAEKLDYRGGLLDLRSKTAYIHKAWLDKLEPGRTYGYRLVGPNFRGEVHKFRTVPVATDEVRFIVYGDSRTQVPIHRRLVEQMMKHDVAFVVNVGDLVSRGDEYPQWGPQFFEPLKGLAERVPIYIARGNHEGQNGTYERLLVPPGAGNDFAFDYGPVHFFCGDNTSRSVDHDRLMRDIVRDARASGAAWKFVSVHVPGVNFGGHWSDWQQGRALPAFAEAGIDFVITGHSHQYERFRPVEPPGPGHAVTYITAGGGGAPLYGIQPTIYHAYARSVHQFCVFHIKSDTLTMDTIDLDGRVIDHLEISKKDGRLNRQYTWAAVPMGGIELHQLLYRSLGAGLPEVPGKDRPSTLNVDLEAPSLPAMARMTFQVRGDAQAYELPEPQVVTVPAEGGRVHVELTITPMVEVSAQGRVDRARPVEPALWLDCHYELGRIRETISRPVTVAAR